MPADNPIPTAAELAEVEKRGQDEPPEWAFIWWIGRRGKACARLSEQFRAYVEQVRIDVSLLLREVQRQAGEAQVLLRNAEKLEADYDILENERDALKARLAELPGKIADVLCADVKMVGGVPGAFPRVECFGIRARSFTPSVRSVQDNIRALIADAAQTDAPASGGGEKS